AVPQLEMAGPDQRLAQLRAGDLLDRQFLRKAGGRDGSRCHRQGAGEQAGRPADGRENGQRRRSFRRIVAAAAEPANVTLVSIASGFPSSRPRPEGPRGETFPPRQAAYRGKRSRRFALRAPVETTGL